MKKCLFVVAIVLLHSCNNLLRTEQYEITYAFVNQEKVTEGDIVKTTDVIKKRITKYTRYVEVVSNSQNQIVIKLRGDFDIESVNNIVENEGKLGFWSCATKEKLISFMLEVDRQLKNDSISKPFSSLVKGMAYDGLPVFSITDTINIRQLLNDKSIKALPLEDEYRDLAFLFGKTSDSTVTMYGVNTYHEKRAPIDESHIIEAKQDYDQIGRPAISIRMNEYGAHKWYKMTNEAYLNQTKIAIVLNDIVHSAPMVSAGPIEGGHSQIAGDFTLEEALSLSYILDSQQRIPKLKFVKMSKIENE
ncbi:hypothetical protein [Winogradskyella sp.]|uniref:SecDF P1 head subdomain-containing protein n=1 Tax=Winogradskyella sp. TaxID=1883156 RepID=UPI00260F2247|nr:hypothetical protein [Winogradskyella sp.]